MHSWSWTWSSGTHSDIRILGWWVPSSSHRWVCYKVSIESLVFLLLGVGRGWRAKQEEKAGANVVDAEDFVEPRLRLG